MNAKQYVLKSNGAYVLKKKLVDGSDDLIMISWLFNVCDVKIQLKNQVIWFPIMCDVQIEVNLGFMVFY